ncbi:MAG TPA: hypothetical protein VJB94_00465 [Candidatus Nanoarchaeia archaeon]|nr:hypothetical protein [Candidatus Nanoarchaeia archaeon]
MIRQRVPDKAKARSIVQAAEIEINFIQTLKPSNQSGITIVSRIYENFRMLGDALLLIRGKEVIGQDHHTEMINELFTLKVNTKRPIMVLNSLKSLRNNINYRGYIPSIKDVQDVISIEEACFEPILKAVKEELNKI